DEVDDVLLKNASSGEVATWLLDSTAKYVSVGGIGTLSAGQNLAGVGDVDGDGVDDVLFTDFDSSLKAWTVNNGAPKGLIALG
ncbi:MAG: hypothetical protein IJT50_12095, partial [Lentisphaeria bacterium]|nr:hypothetical protein [Lentisphaeria bacterium]